MERSRSAEKPGGGSFRTSWGTGLSALCLGRRPGWHRHRQPAAPSVRTEGRPEAPGRAGRRGPGPGQRRRPLLRPEGAAVRARPALSCSCPSLCCPRPRSLFGAETPLTSEPLARRSPAPRARLGPQTARCAAQPSLAGPPPALPAASPSLPGPPGLPPPRSADSSPGTGGRATLLAATTRAVSPAREARGRPASRRFGCRGSAAPPAASFLPACPAAQARGRGVAAEPLGCRGWGLGRGTGWPGDTAAPRAHPQTLPGFPFLGRSFRRQERTGDA